MKCDACEVEVEPPTTMADHKCDARRLASVKQRRYVAWVKIWAKGTSLAYTAIQKHTDDIKAVFEPRRLAGDKDAFKDARVHICEIEGWPVSKKEAHVKMMLWAINKIGNDRDARDAFLYAINMFNKTRDTQ